MFPKNVGYLVALRTLSYYHRCTRSKLPRDVFCVVSFAYPLNIIARIPDTVWVLGCVLHGKMHCSLLIEIWCFKEYTEKTRHLKRTT